MRDFLLITKALSDETRVRLLLALREGELCLCQIVELLGLAPSTVSKHVDILRQARLVDMRKDGRWHYYRMAEQGCPPAVQEALRWALGSLRNDRTVLTDAAKLLDLRARDQGQLTACYSREPS